METVSNWGATYVPGRWVVLAGPTSVVIMQPAPAHMSGLLNDLWLDVLSAADVGELAQKFSAFRLDLMPHFAAFFWAEDGMHSLIRGGLRAVDAETGDVVAQGEEFHTWNEVGLQNVRQVHVDMDEIDTDAVFQLPLAVGVVLAASVTIDSTQKVPLVLPTVAAEGAVSEAPESDEEPAVMEHAPEPAAELPAAEPAEEEVAQEPAADEVAQEPAADEVAEEPAAEEAAQEPVVPDEPAGRSPSLVAGAALAEGALAAPLTFQAEEPELPEVPASANEETEVLTDEDPEPYVAEQSLPIDTDDLDQPADFDQPAQAAGSFDENSDEILPPVELSWPASHEPAVHPDGDAWGVRNTESFAPVDLFVDEDGDGIPDEPQSGLDLGFEPADAPAEPVALEVADSRPPQAGGFPGFPGADVEQHQGGFLASPAPSPSSVAQAPQGPPPGWNQSPRAPYGQPQGDPYGPQYGQVPTGPAMPFAVPGGQFAPPAQAPGFPGQAYPGQPYPGQPFPGQPGQPAPYGQPGQYAVSQQPSYPPSPQYAGPMSPNGGPAASPVPPPNAAYAPAAPPPQGPGAPSEPGLPASADSADSDGTVFSTGIAMTHKPAAPRQQSDNLVLAVVCSFGHPNPPGSQGCRRCGQPVDNANPRLVHKPVMAQLITAGGARIELTDAVLIGRAPAAQPGDGNPILLPVPSPNSDISRTHLKVAVKDWDIVATDLHSTNGTMLVRPGQAPVRMMPGTPVTIEPGTILDLGDGGVITVGMPA